MLDFIFNLIEEIFDCGEEIVENGKEFIEPAVDTISDFVNNADLADVLLVAGTIFVTRLTVDTIRDELRNCQELRGKNATRAIVKKFIDDHGCTVVPLEIINAQNKPIGTIPIKARAISGVYPNQIIEI